MITIKLTMLLGNNSLVLLLLHRHDVYTLLTKSTYLITGLFNGS